MTQGRERGWQGGEGLGQGQGWGGGGEGGVGHLRGERAVHSTAGRGRMTMGADYGAKVGDAGWVGCDDVGVGCGGWGGHNIPWPAAGQLMQAKCWALGAMCLCQQGKSCALSLYSLRYVKRRPSLRVRHAHSLPSPPTSLPDLHIHAAAAPASSCRAVPCHAAVLLCHAAVLCAVRRA